jgi:hypothetical protein
LGENGQAGAEAPAQLLDQVVITRNRATGEVALGGNVTDLDLILDMLGRATRHTDVQFRIIAAVQAQEDIKRKKAEMELAHSIMGGGFRKS